MKMPVVFAVMLGLLAARPTFAADLALRTMTDEAAEPLTTESLWAIDPGETNPQRQRWALARDTQLLDLVPRRLPNGAFGVRAGGVESKTHTYVRGAGPWFLPFDKFSCAVAPDDWFSTRDGALRAAAVAAEAWSNELHSSVHKLALDLGHVSNESPTAALEQGRWVFKRWLEARDAIWRTAGKAKARKAEWRGYLSAGQVAGVCPRGHAPEPPDWRDLIEPPAQGKIGKTLVHAPAKRWNGSLSVRLNLLVGGTRLDGQFLVSSSIPSTSVGPEFLENQGIRAVWLEVPGVAPKKVAWRLISGVARPATVEDLEMSGLELPVSYIQVIDGVDKAAFDLYGQPTAASPCCDGVVGTDVLRHYVVRFTEGKPLEVQLISPEGYHGPEGAEWVEASLDDQGQIVSSCTVEARDSGGKKILGVDWATLWGGSVATHSPRKSLKGRWKLTCGDLEIARGASFDERLESPLTQAKSEAVDVGMAVLGRGPFAFDLPHGRIWFEKPSLDKPIEHNESGLELKYVNGKHYERVLAVARVSQRGPSKKLYEAGLRVGDVVTRVDSIPAEDIDQWDVERRLAGAYGDTVTVEWRVGKGLKAAPMEVK